MVTLNCFTNGFAGQPSSVSGQTPRRCQWVFYQNPWPGITVFEDGHMFEQDPREVVTDLRVGWLHESRGLRPENYERAWNVRNRFDFILTHDTGLLVADPTRFRPCIRGGVTVAPSQWGLHPKTKHVAIIASPKTATAGHRLRHAIAQWFGGQVDVYGLEGWADKAQVLRDYRYAIAVEADQEGRLFTDHLLDVVALGCVPIYWGTPYIGEYLDAGGMLVFNGLDGLEHILAGLADNGQWLYQVMRKVLARNLALLDDYAITEDWFTRQYLEQIA